MDENFEPGLSREVARPLKLIAAAFTALTRRLRAPFRPMLRRKAQRKARELTELSVLLGWAGHEKESADIAAVANGWNRIAAGLEETR